MATLPCSLPWRAVAFGAGAASIGLVVVPTEALLASGVPASQVVAARLFWGASTLLFISLVTCPKKLARPPVDHLRLMGVGLLLGWATVELYTRALDEATVLPVIVLLVAASAVTGMLFHLRTGVRACHLFVVLSVVISVAATVHAASPVLDLPTRALIFAVMAGILYGALPVLCRNTGSGPDIAAVAIYLFYGTLWSLGFSTLLDGEPTREILSTIITYDAFFAGVFCTGLGYALFQIGISPDQDGRRLATSWASLLYGFEPIVAILAASLFLDQTVTRAVFIFAMAFVVLVGLAGPTLEKLAESES